MAHIVGTEFIESLGDLDLLLGIKKGIGKLLSLAQCAFDDLEARDVAQEVGDRVAVTVGIPRG